MTHRRQKSPGSFQDEIGGLIERVAPIAPKPPAKPKSPKERAVSDPSEVNDRLFETAWRRDR